MTENLYALAIDSKHNKDSLNKIIEMFAPKIHQSLRQTQPQNREDLSQEIKIKLLNCIQEYDVEKTPGYFEMLDLLG